MRDGGFGGDQIFATGHSIGSLILSDYTKSHPDTFKGLMLMGGSLNRKFRTNDQPETKWDFPVPVQTLAGSKDGMYRISRNAESYYHQV